MWTPLHERRDNFPLDLNAGAALARSHNKGAASAPAFVGLPGTDFNTQQNGRIDTLSLNIRGNPIDRRNVAPIPMGTSLVYVNGG